jgi:hypothetical protein
MKSYGIHLLFVSTVLITAFTYGQQSACPPGSEALCRPPSRSSGPEPNHQPAPTKPDDDSDSQPPSNWHPLTSKEIAEEYRAAADAASTEGWAAKDRYFKSGADADYKAAMDAYSRSLRSLKMNDSAVVGLTSLLVMGNDHRNALAWAKAGEKSVKAGKLTHEWFKLMIEQETNEVDRLDYKDQCGEIRTSKSAPIVVDSSIDVMKALRRCREWMARIDAADNKIEADSHKYQEKFRKQGQR